MKSVEALVADILRREGGFTDNPADRGGPTNFGITHKTLARYKGRPVTKAEVKAMPMDLAVEIYLRNYYNGPRINTLVAQIRPFVFDSAVNHGPRRAVKFVQRICNLAGFGPIDEDGAVGPATRRSAKEAQIGMDGWFLPCLVTERRLFYRQIIANDPSQAVFEDGWENRVAEFDTALPVEV